MCRSGDRAGDVRRSRGLGRPDGIVARETIERATRQERGEGELAAVLLADDDHEGNPVVARARDRVHGVPEPRCRVEVDERGSSSAERVAGCDPYDRPLVQGEHEAEVVGKVAEERDLGRPRVAEHRRHPVPAHDVEGRVAHGGHGMEVSLTGREA